MKKVMLIMAAALLMMTQCKKENETPNGPAEGTMKMTVTAGPGRTSINTGNGTITWSEDDKLYVSDGTNWLGSLTLASGAGTANGTFTGSIAGIGEGTTPCHFFYLGHDNGMTGPTASSSDPVSISFAAQDGTLDGAMKYHIGYGSTDVTVKDGEYQGYVIMDTKIAIAHINFTTDGESAYTGSVTMGGTGIFNTLSVSPDGSTFTGSGDEGITIGNGGGTTGERYVTLIPTGTGRVDVSFTGDATGSMTFLAGISEKKFYGMKDALTVTLEAAAAPKFTVGMDGDTPRTVEFAPGNLYWDGSAFRFEADQWSSTNSWNINHVSHFYWSNTASVTYQQRYSDPYASMNDVFFTNDKETTANQYFTVNGEGGKWRTLSDEEWNYLLNGRTGASSMRAWVTLTDVNVSGLVILPDDSSATASSITTSLDLADAGAVFLPAAGSRNYNMVSGFQTYSGEGTIGYYWSSWCNKNSSKANYFFFNSGNVNSGDEVRYHGMSVRLVSEN